MECSLPEFIFLNKEIGDQEFPGFSCPKAVDGEYLIEHFSEAQSGLTEKGIIDPATKKITSRGLGELQTLKKYILAPKKIRLNKLWVGLVTRNSCVIFEMNGNTVRWNFFSNLEVLLFIANNFPLTDYDPDNLENLDAELGSEEEMTLSEFKKRFPDGGDANLLVQIYKLDTLYDAVFFLQKDKKTFAYEFAKENLMKIAAAQAIVYIQKALNVADKDIRI